MMEKTFKSTVTEYLNKLDLPYRCFTHPGPIHSLEQAAAERGQHPDQIVRSILFRVSQDEYVMVLIAGKRQVSWPVLRKFLGKSRISMASEDEVLQVTGYPLGAVSPFGLKNPLRLLVDPSVFQPAEISIGSGQRGTTVIMQQEHFHKALQNYEINPFTSGESGISE